LGDNIAESEDLLELSESTSIDDQGESELRCALNEVQWRGACHQLDRAEAS
jgi:hypothetical protein